MTEVTLTYDLDVGFQPSNPGTPLFVKAANIIFDPNGDTAGFIGMTLDGDITEPGPDRLIRRRLVYKLDPSALLYFPTAAAIIAATRNLFGRIFSSQMPAFVTAHEPVVT